MLIGIKRDYEEEALWGGVAGLQHGMPFCGGFKIVPEKVGAGQCN
jgi:hypothetical protein